MTMPSTIIRIFAVYGQQRFMGCDIQSSGLFAGVCSPSWWNPAEKHTSPARVLAGEMLDGRRNRDDFIGVESLLKYRFFLVFSARADAVTGHSGGPKGLKATEAITCPKIHVHR